MPTCARCPPSHPPPAATTGGSADSPQPCRRHVEPPHSGRASGTRRISAAPGRVVPLLSHCLPRSPVLLPHSQRPHLRCLSPPALRRPHVRPRFAPALWRAARKAECRDGQVCRGGGGAAVAAARAEPCAHERCCAQRRGMGACVRRRPRGTFEPRMRLQRCPARPVAGYVIVPRVGPISGMPFSAAHLPHAARRSVPPTRRVAPPPPTSPITRLSASPVASQLGVRGGGRQPARPRDRDAADQD
eukprot:7390964-Prymnesium_polylepis.1